VLGTGCAKIQALASSRRDSGEDTGLGGTRCGSGAALARLGGGGAGTSARGACLFGVPAASKALTMSRWARTAPEPSGGPSGRGAGASPVGRERQGPNRDQEGHACFAIGRREGFVIATTGRGGWLLSAS
jgi:hypothetical protein